MPWVTLVVRRPWRLPADVHGSVVSSHNATHGDAATSPRWNRSKRVDAAAPFELDVGADYVDCTRSVFHGAIRPRDARVLAVGSDFVTAPAAPSPADHDRTAHVLIGVGENVSDLHWVGNRAGTGCGASVGSAAWCGRCRSALGGFVVGVSLGRMLVVAAFVDVFCVLLVLLFIVAVVLLRGTELSARDAGVRVPIAVLVGSVAGRALRAEAGTAETEALTPSDIALSQVAVDAAAVDVFGTAVGTSLRALCVVHAPLLCGGVRCGWC